MRITLELSPTTGPVTWVIRTHPNGVEAESEAGRVALQGDHAHRAVSSNRELGITGSNTPRSVDGSTRLRVALQDSGVTITTDRLGTVLLYLRPDHGRLRASSSLGELGRHCGATLDEDAAWELMLLGQPLGDRTLLKGVRLMPAATHLRWEASGNVTETRYWQASPNRETRETPAHQRDVDELIQRLGQAHERAGLDRARLAVPVTGGLDSRINLALLGGRTADARLFTVHSPGDPEVGIARRIARRLRVELEEIPFTPASWWALLDGEPWSGEIHRHQFWLSPVGSHLATTAPPPVLLDGYLQDALFNPRIVTASAENALHRRVLGYAAYRAQALPHPRMREVLAGLWERTDAHYSSLGQPGLEANQRFYLENRSRRFVFDSVRLAQLQAPVALPGIDHELMDFAMALPWNLRHGGPLYREAIQRLSPALAAVPYDKTGLPVSSRRTLSTSRRVRKVATRALNRLWPGRPFLRAAEPPLAIGMRRSPEFRAAVADRLDGSRWLAHLFETENIGTRLAHQEIPEGRTLPILLGAITTANLERFTTESHRS
ncbi:MAG: hypothetical protein FKY71_10975 [Spiribacter salinus]|uniref:asparagine synthase (glutamine-hydrolyzing) n=1 Tax=Spiribacter salinus TaxID=1335746 RepID=A0A540VQD8_9GAMM|nr:MAG: hypothetical protein FKY71_10975 [Spiribacter salinus]